MKKILICITLLLAASSVQAQTATGSSKLAWDQPAATLAAANAFGYGYYADGSATKSGDFTGVTCTGSASPFACSAPFPAFTPVTHTIQVVAIDKSVTPNLESNKSLVFTFTFVVQPGTPLNIRIGG